MTYQSLDFRTVLQILSKFTTILRNKISFQRVLLCETEDDVKKKQLCNGEILAYTYLLFTALCHLYGPFNELWIFFSTPTWSIYYLGMQMQQTVQGTH